MEIKKAIVLINLDVDNSKELRQLVLSESEMDNLIELLNGGYISKTLKVLDNKIESIEIEDR